MRLVPVDPHEAARRLEAMPAVFTYQALAVAKHMVLSNAVAGRISFTASIRGAEPEALRSKAH